MIGYGQGMRHGYDQVDLNFLRELWSLSLSSSWGRLQSSQRNSMCSTSSGLALMPAHSRWYQLEPLHLFSLLHWIQQDSWMTLPQMHFSSSSLSPAARLFSFSGSSSRSMLRLGSLSLRWSSPLFFWAWQMFSSSRSLRTTLSRLKELKKARSVREWMCSGLMARMVKVCSRCWITLLFSGMSAIFECELVITSRNSFSSVIVPRCVLMFSKSSLQAGLVRIIRSTSSRWPAGTFSPNFSSARWSLLLPLIDIIPHPTPPPYIHPFKCPRSPTPSSSARNSTRISRSQDCWASSRPPSGPICWRSCRNPPGQSPLRPRRTARCPST